MWGVWGDRVSEELYVYNVREAKARARIKKVILSEYASSEMVW